MRKILYVFVFGILLLSGCVRMAENNENSEHPLSIRDARMFFDEFKNDLRLGAVNGTGGWTNNSSGTRSIADDPLAGIQPDWTQARYSELLGEEVVEVPFNDVSLSITFVSDSVELETVPPPNTAVKLVAGVDVYGQIYYNVVYVTCAADFLENHNVRTLKISDLDSSFSGAIRRYEVNGNFVSGIIVKENKIVGTVKPLNNQSNAPQRVRPGDVTEEYPLGNCPVTKTLLGWYVYATATETIAQAYYDYNIVCPDQPDKPDGGGNGNENNGNNNGKPDDKDPPDPPEEPDIKPILKILVQPASVMLGEEFTVTVSVSPDSLNMFPLKIKVGISDERSIQANMPTTFVALAPGVSVITPVITYKGRDYNGGGHSIAVRFPDVSMISQGALGIFDDLWSRTENWANYHNTVREYGTTIYVNTLGGSLQYESGDITEGQAYGRHGSTPSLAMPKGNDQNGTLLTGGRWRVARVHTHPPRFSDNSGAPTDRINDRGPSDKDKEAFDKDILPWFIIDHNDGVERLTTQDGFEKEHYFYHLGDYRK